MRADPRYTPSDIFETFPRPSPSRDLEMLGRELEERRKEIMLSRNLGITRLYNLANSPDVTNDEDADTIRSIHLRIDRAVMSAYGWGDIPLDHGFHTYRQMERWTVDPPARIEILDRLLEENHRRAKLEAEAASTKDSRRGKSFEESATPEGAMF